MGVAVTGFYHIKLWISISAGMQALCIFNKIVFAELYSVPMEFQVVPW